MYAAIKKTLINLKNTVMKSYVITDRSTESTKYYAGLNGWVNLPENAIWYETEKEASAQKDALKGSGLKVEEIETA